MATAPIPTFQELSTTPEIQDAVDASPISRAAGDTLTDVIADDTRRNKLIDDNNLIKGVCMTASGPLISSRELIVRPSTLNAVIDNRATIATTTVEAEFTNSLMESNYNSVSVQVSAPYVTASADYSNETSYKNTETEKTIMMSSRYLFPQGRIDFTPPSSGLQGAMELNPDFMNAVNAALAKTSKNDQREALYSLFEEYGHIFRTKVQIGGTLSAHTMETFSRSESETSVKEDMKAGLEVAVKDWGTGVTAGHGNTQTTITTKQGRTLDVRYIVEGGDYTKIQKTEEWIASTSDSVYWRAIEVTEAVAVVDLLPDSVRDTVKTLMIPLLGQWVTVEQVPNTTMFPTAIYRPKGIIPSGWYFLGHTADATQALIVKPTLGLKQGRNMAMVPGQLGSGLTDQPFPTQPLYEFMSTYFGGYNPSVAPGQSVGALRPGLFLEGRWELRGNSIDTMIYITRPNPPQAPEDECFDLQPVVRVNQTNPPKARWAVRKNVVLFNSGES